MLLPENITRAYIDILKEEVGLYCYNITFFIMGGIV